MEKIFIDSGAHGIYNDAFKRSEVGYAFYDTQTFTDYLDAYCEFIRANEKAVIYPNLDAIFNPELTWEIQMRIENEYGLRPMPVIHFGAPAEYLRRYLERGYPYICLGGMGQTGGVSAYKKWADEMWDIICDTPDRTPCCKVHGFAMTSITLMRRYPWYSVDSSSWLKVAAYGGILLPKKKNGEWDFSTNYTTVKVTHTATAKRGNLNKKSHKMQLVKEFCDFCKVPFGESSFKKVQDGYELQKGEKWAAPLLVETIITPGVCNDSNARATVNAVFYTNVVKAIPEWPWAFNSKQYKKETLW